MADLALLDKVFMRLAMAGDKDDDLTAFLQSFLAPLLLKFASQEPGVKGKVVEIMSHVNRIVKSRPQVQLPVSALIAQLSSVDVPASIKPLTRLYIELGFPRLSEDSQLFEGMALMQALRIAPSALRVSLTLMTLPLLSKWSLPAIAPLSALGLESPADVSFFLGLLCDVLLLNNCATQPLNPSPGESLRPRPPAGHSRNSLVGSCSLHRLFLFPANSRRTLPDPPG